MQYSNCSIVSIVVLQDGINNFSIHRFIFFVNFNFFYKKIYYFYCNARTYLLYEIFTF